MPIILLTSIFTVGTVTSSPSTELRAPTIINPALGIGDTFDVNITVVNVTNLYGWDVKLSFNPAVLEAKAVSMPTPNFLGPSSAWAIGLLWPAIDNSLGTVKMGDTFMPPLPPVGVNGSGTLATVTFEVKAENTISPLEIVLPEQFPTITLLYTYEAGWKMYIPHEVIDGAFDNRVTVQPPVASFYPEPPFAEVNETITFNASASYDQDAWLVSYEWDYDDGTTEIYKGENLTAIATHAYDQGGIYTVQLTVTDYDNLTNSTTTDVTVLALVHDVAVKHISAPTSVYVGELVTIRVLVENLGGYNETFEVKVTYDTSTIETPKSVTLHTSAPTEYIEFNWNTTEVNPDSYTITAEAILAEDANPNNNLLSTFILVDLPLGTIAGIVTDTSTGDPIESASVTTNSYSNITDTEGLYSIELSPGTYNVTASATGYISNTIEATVIVNKTATVNFALEPLIVFGSINGTVTDSDSTLPVAGAIITADGYSTTTDESGYYEMEVEAGTYTVTASKAGYESASQTNVTVVAEETIITDFELEPLTHTLTVISDPISGVEFSIDEGVHTTVWSDTLKEGNYTVVMPYTWHIGTDEYTFDHWEDASTDPARVISLTANMTITATYKPVEVYHTLTVNSEPIAEIDFTVDGATQTTPWSDSLIEGYHTVVMPSEWTVGADVYNFDHWEDASTNRTRTISLTENTTITATYELYVPPSGWIEGTVIDAETTQPIAGATVAADTAASAITDESGYYKIEIEPGTYTVIASKAGYESASQTNVTVVAEETITVHFQLTPAPLTIDTIILQVEDFYEQGEIDKLGIQTSLINKLYAAKAKIDVGKTKTAKNILKAFINHLEAQSGKHVSEEAANTLIAGAQNVISSL